MTNPGRSRSMSGKFAEASWHWYFSTEDDLVARIYEFCLEHAATVCGDLNMEFVPGHPECVKTRQTIRQGLRELTSLVEGQIVDSIHAKREQASNDDKHAKREQASNDDN